VRTGAKFSAMIVKRNTLRQNVKRKTKQLRKPWQRGMYASAQQNKSESRVHVGRVHPRTLKQAKTHNQVRSNNPYICAFQYKEASPSKHNESYSHSACKRLIVAMHKAREAVRGRETICQVSSSYLVSFVVWREMELDWHP